MGKKITIEFPDWWEEQHIRIFVGKEDYMTITAKGKMYRKISRCNMCGKCCQMKARSQWPFVTHMIDGIEYCIFCEKQGKDIFICTCHIAPWACHTDNPNNRKHKGKANPDCVIEYEEIDVTYEVADS